LPNTARITNVAEAIHAFVKQRFRPRVVALIDRNTTKVQQRISYCLLVTQGNCTWILALF
jgi:hypothetical protein